MIGKVKTIVNKTDNGLRVEVKGEILANQGLHPK